MQWRLGGSGGQRQGLFWWLIALEVQRAHWVDESLPHALGSHVGSVGLGRRSTNEHQDHLENVNIALLLLLRTIVGSWIILVIGLWQSEFCRRYHRPRSGWYICHYLEKNDDGIVWFTVSTLQNAGWEKWSENIEREKEYIYTWISIAIISKF